MNKILDVRFIQTLIVEWPGSELQFWHQMALLVHCCSAAGCEILCSVLQHQPAACSNCCQTLHIYQYCKSWQILQLHRIIGKVGNYNTANTIFTSLNILIFIVTILSSRQQLTYLSIWYLIITKWEIDVGGRWYDSSRHQVFTLWKKNN